MKTYKKTIIKAGLIIAAIAIIVINFSCKKFLEAPQTSSETLLNTVSDCQQLLNNYNLMNTGYPSDGEASSDNYFMTDANYNTQSVEDRQVYTWDANAQRSSSTPQWLNSYRVVENANLVLEALAKIDTGDTVSYNSVKGQALFFRAYGFYQIAQLYCKPYNKTTASQDPGIPLNSSSDINTKSARGTVEETYNRIVKDVQAAASLLPSVSGVASTPNKASAYGFLARTYLAMSDYANAASAATLCLQLHSDLLNYNSISKTSTVPFNPRFNKEVIFQSVMANSTVTFNNGVSVTNDALLTPTKAFVDSLLYASYNANDLRKQIFFKKNTGANAATYKFTGNYDGTAAAAFFDGIATDEIYLIRAECYARGGNVNGAMSDLNTLLSSRWISGTYTNYTASDASDALNQVLAERRKELLFRGLRWTDIRRLNLVVSTQLALARKIGGQTYTLQPNDPRYVLLLPADVIANSTMPQNPR